MPVCSNCKLHISEKEAKFCPQCGTELILGDNDVLTSVSAENVKIHLKRIRTAWIAGIVCGIATLIVSVMSAMGTYIAGFSAWNLIDAILVFGLTFGIYRKSRVCAVIMFAYYVINEMSMWAELDIIGILAGLPVATLIGYCFFQGVRGTFAYHRMVKPNNNVHMSWARKDQRIYAKRAPLLALGLVGIMVVGGFLLAITTTPEDMPIQIGSSTYTLSKEAQKYLRVYETSDYEAARSVLIIEEPHYSLEGQLALYQGLEVFFRDNPNLAGKTVFLSEGAVAGQQVSVEPLVKVAPHPADEMVRRVLDTFLIPGYIAYEWKHGSNIPITGIEDETLYNLSADLWIRGQEKPKDIELGRLWDFTVVGRNERISMTLLDQCQKYENPVLFVGGLHLDKMDVSDFEKYKSSVTQAKTGLGAKYPSSQIANKGIYDYLKQAKIGYTFLVAVPQKHESAAAVNKSTENYVRLMQAQQKGQYDVYIQWYLSGEKKSGYAVTVKPSPASAAQFLAASIQASTGSVNNDNFKKKGGEENKSGWLNNLKDLINKLFGNKDGKDTFIPVKCKEVTRKGDNLVDGQEISEQEAVKCVKEGKDIEASSQEQAESIARQAGDGKDPVFDNPHKQGYSSHYHTNGRGKGHVFFE